MRTHDWTLRRSYFVGNKGVDLARGLVAWNCRGEANAANERERAETAPRRVRRLRTSLPFVFQHRAAT